MQCECACRHLMRGIVELVGVKPACPHETFYTSIQDGVIKELKLLIKHYTDSTGHVLLGTDGQRYSYPVVKELCAVLQECTCCERHQTDRPALPKPSQPEVTGSSLPLFTSTDGLDQYYYWPRYVELYEPVSKHTQAGVC